MTDPEIINLFFSKSPKALKAVNNKYGKYCFAIAYNILSSREDSDECVNDTFFAAWNAIPPAKPNRLSAYLGRITRNIALNRYKLLHTDKRKGIQTELVLSELSECIPANTDTEQAFNEAYVIHAIEAYLKAQPEIKRNIFIRRYFYMYPVKDIAKAYAYSQSKITSLLFRMREELRSYLEREGINI